MRGKKAVIVAELIDESLGSTNDTIAEDLLKWFQDAAVPAPWVKNVKKLLFSSFKHRIGLHGLLGSTLLTRW